MLCAAEKSQRAGGREWPGGHSGLGTEAREFSQWRWYLNVTLKDKLVCTSIHSSTPHTFSKEATADTKVW